MVGGWGVRVVALVAWLCLLFWVSGRFILGNAEPVLAVVSAHLVEGAVNRWWAPVVLLVLALAGSAWAFATQTETQEVAAVYLALFAFATAFAAAAAAGVLSLLLVAGVGLRRLVLRP